MNNLYRKYKIWRAFKPKNRIYLYKSMSFRANQGSSLSASLSKYADAYSEKGEKIGDYLQEIATSIKSGESYVAAFKGYIPNNELLILSSGEDDISKLSTCFKDAAFMCASQHALNKSFKKVLKSAIVRLALVFVFFIGMAFLISGIIQSLMIDSLPWYTEAFLSFSAHIKSFWWLWLIGFIVLIFVVRYMMPRYVGRFRPFLSKYIFPFNTYRLMVSSSFLIGFSSLINGRSHTQALKSIADTSDPYLQSYAYKMYEDSLSGLNSEQIYDVSLFDIFLKINLIDILESTESSDGVKELSIHEMELSSEKFDAINKTINSVVMAVMALSIVWVWLSLAIPILEMFSQQVNF